jgi:tripartite-type tricarboxylate transporter receptor subunit TctC
MRRRAVLLALALAGPALAPSAHAQDSRPIRLVVPFAAGGPTDVVARLAAERLAVRLAQPVFVENRGGAGGTIGARAVLGAEPDGHTLLYGTLGSQVLSPLLARPQPPYDPRDFAAIGLVATLDNVLLVNPALPVADVADLVLRIRRQPASYGSSGAGQPTHLSALLFLQRVRAGATHVPYRGTAPALTDLIGGRLDFMFDALSSAVPHVRAGTVRALAVTGRARSAALPGVPTMEEAGVADYQTYTWQAVFAPPRTPAPVVRRLADALADVTNDAGLRLRLAELGTELTTGGPGAVGQLIAREWALWGPIVAASGATLDQ